MASSSSNRRAVAEADASETGKSSLKRIDAIGEQQLKLRNRGAAALHLQGAVQRRCHGKMGTPQNGDPGSPYSREYGDPGPHFPGKMGTPGPHFPREYGDPLSENGDPLYDRWLTVGKWGSNIIRLEESDLCKA